MKGDRPTVHADRPDGLGRSCLGAKTPAARLRRSGTLLEMCLDWIDKPTNSKMFRKGEQTMTTATSLTSTYLVTGMARADVVLSSPRLRFTLLVNEASGQVCGHAQITEQELLEIPNSEINIGNITGQIQRTGVGSFTRLVSLQGYADVKIGRASC